MAVSELRLVRTGCWQTSDCHFLIARRNDAWRIVART